MTFCTKCGEKLKAGAKFCTICGAKMNVKKPEEKLPEEQPKEPIKETPEKPTPQVTPTPPPPPSKPVQPTYVAPPKSKSKLPMYVGVIAVVAILVIAVFYVGFMMGKEGKKEDTSPKGTENYGVVMGKVTDTDGTSLEDVTVTADGQPVETNDQGWFSISNVTAGDRVLVEFSKNGHATTYRVVEVQTGESNFIEATVSPVDETSSFSAPSGGTTTTSDGGSLNVGTNALEDSQGNTFTGTAHVSMTTFDPTDDEEANAFPGEYRGINAQGETVPIKSYGFMDISVTDGYGNELQIADGKSAAIKIPVPTSMQSEAASMSTCPLWYYDTNTGYWQEEGQGTYDSGNFVGTITHFSTWNFDVAYPRAYISGRVVDSSGNPVQGAVVNCWGPGWKYSRWASGETSTASDGTFTRIPVECTVIFNYKASKGGYDSATYTIPSALECDEEYNVGDIVLGAVPSAQITLTWGENPRDLDSHLIIPATATEDAFHLYYPRSVDKGYDYSSTYPHANLDTDDTSSYGPEVVSIFNYYPGTYRYSVRHYAGSGTIETSGAEVNVIIQGVGIYKFTPPTGQPDGTKIWRIIDIVVDSSGAITAVNTINDYVEGGDSSELLYP